MLDDIIVWWVDDEWFDVMPNASNTSRVLDAVGGEDVTAGRAMIAVQGPTPAARLAAVAPDAAAVARFHVTRFAWDGARRAWPPAPATPARTASSCRCRPTAAADVWRAVLGAGIEPAGLGARDTLRLEAGLPLHGHELGPGITPLQAGLQWVVGWKKPIFRGKAALEAERERGVSRRLRGIATEGRRPPREGCAVLIDGQPAGALTSGNFSPVLGHGIGLAFLPPDVEEGTAVEVDVRGSLAHRPGRAPAVRQEGSSSSLTPQSCSSDGAALRATLDEQPPLTRTPRWAGRST